MTDKIEDQEFVRGLAAGDQRVLEEIYQTFFPPIRGFVRNNGGNTDDAKDIFQEGIMVMYRLVRQPDFKLSASFLSLLFGICRNIWYKSLRKRHYYDEVSEMKELSQPMEEGIVEVITARTTDRLFRQKVNALGEKCRQLLELFFDGEKMKDIVDQLSLSSVSFAKKKKFQCKEKLVQMVQRDPVFQELSN